MNLGDIFIPMYVYLGYIRYFYVTESIHIRGKGMFIFFQRASLLRPDINLKMQYSYYLSEHPQICAAGVFCIVYVPIACSVLGQ